MEFDASNVLHLEFVSSAANLRAQMYGIEQNLDKADIAKMATAVVLEEFVPKSGVKIATTEAEAGRNDGFMG